MMPSQSAHQMMLPTDCAQKLMDSESAHQIDTFIKCPASYASKWCRSNWLMYSQTIMPPDMPTKDSFNQYQIQLQWSHIGQVSELSNSERLTEFNILTWSRFCCNLGSLLYASVPLCWIIFNGLYVTASAHFKQLFRD